jgi:WD40 repeat protein
MFNTSTLSPKRIQRQNFPMWNELPKGITDHQIIPFLNPMDLSKCSVVSKRWHRYITNPEVWQPSALRHFPSMPPKSFQSFREYQLLFCNLSKGVCSEETLLGHTNYISSLILKGDTLFSASCDGTIKLWNLGNGTCTHTLQEGNPSEICALALGDRVLYSGGIDRKIKKWDLESKQCIAILQDNSPVLSLAITDTTLISASYAGAIKIWGLQDDTCQTIFSNDALFKIALKEGVLFSCSYSDHAIKKWNLEAKDCVATLEGHCAIVSALAVKGGEELFSGSFDHTVQRWDLNSGACTATLEEHYGGINSLALSDIMLFSASDDNTIRAWDLQSNDCNAILFGHKDKVISLAFEGTKLCSGCRDNTIKIWDFAASHLQIFMEIARQFKSEDLLEVGFAIDRFSKMPKVAQNKVFHKLAELFDLRLKPKHRLKWAQDAFYGKQDAFYGKNGKGVTNAQRAQAIIQYYMKEIFQVEAVNI